MSEILTEPITTTREQFVEHLLSGVIPPSGITRRAGKLAGVVIRTKVNDELVDVPDVSIQQSEQ